MSIRSSMKLAAVQALYRAGVTARLVDRRTRDGILVLMYHRVLPEQERIDSFSSEGIVVSPRTFDLHMRVLRENFFPVTPDDASAILTGARRAPARACLVTFDDGWFDNETHALPILQRHRIPALIFAATDYLGTARCFWQERLARLLFFFWLHGDRSVTSAPDSDPQRAKQNILAHIAMLKRSGRSAALRALATAEDALESRGEKVANGPDRFMNWEQVRRASATGLITIGSHACSHSPLTELATDAVARELTASADEIEHRTGNRPVYLAYPNGDHDTERAGIAGVTGYQLAFTTESRIASCQDDRLRLPRINIAETGTSSRAGFFSRIAGLS